MANIKFRAWEKSSNEMVYDIQNVSRKRIIGESACESFQEVIDSWEYEVMQFTGLHDKSKSPIYEGDILGKEGHWSFYIGFKDACFVMVPCNSVQRVNWTWNPVGQNMIEGWEIIGNIYKNQELLMS